MPSYVSYLVFVLLSIPQSNQYILKMMAGAISDMKLSSDDYFTLNHINPSYMGISGEVEHACQTVIKPNFRPTVGHTQNGSFVEILQDEAHGFSINIVECDINDRPSCHGVNSQTYYSECSNVYSHRSAFVRIAGSESEFVSSTIKIPIACECRLRKNKKVSLMNVVYNDMGSMLK